MTILIYDSVGTSNFMTLFRDSDDPRRFYYVPQFAGVDKFPNGKLKFGARLFTASGGQGKALYNFAVSAVIPIAELRRAKADLDAQYGPNVRLTMITPDAEHPTLVPITDGIYNSIKCQARGIDLYSGMNCSFVIPESLEPGMSQFFQTATAWVGEIDFAVRTKKTSFKWSIRANWHRIQEHFRSQVSVKYWFIKANLSYETQRLIENDTLHIEITGGTPSQKERVYAFAEKIAQRLFVPTLQPNPFPAHPEGAAVCFSLNYSRVEEDRTSIWSGEENDYEVKPLGLGALVANIPPEYFSGYDYAVLQERWETDREWLFSFATDEELARNRKR